VAPASIAKLWRAELALKACFTGKFRIAFIVAAAEAGILPSATEHDLECEIGSDEKLAAENR